MCEGGRHLLGREHDGSPPPPCHTDALPLSPPPPPPHSHLSPHVQGVARDAPPPPSPPLAVLHHTDAALPPPTLTSALMSRTWPATSPVMSVISTPRWVKLRGWSRSSVEVPATASVVTDTRLASSTSVA